MKAADCSLVSPTRGKSGVSTRMLPIITDEDTCGGIHPDVSTIGKQLSRIRTILPSCAPGTFLPSHYKMKKPRAGVASQRIVRPSPNGLL